MPIFPNIVSSSSVAAIRPPRCGRPSRKRNANVADPETKAVAPGRIGRLFRRAAGVVSMTRVFLGYQALAMDPMYFPFIFIESRTGAGFVSLMDFRVYLLF
jgi:hypothetical protein